MNIQHYLKKALPKPGSRTPEGEDGEEEEEDHATLVKKYWWKFQFGPEMSQVSMVMRRKKIPTEHQVMTVQQWPKFAVVRDPLDRIVSAWREKLGPLAKGDTLNDKIKFWVNFHFFPNNLSSSFFCFF